MHSDHQTPKNIPSEWHEIALDLINAHPTKSKLIFALIMQVISVTQDIPAKFDYEYAANDIKKILSNILSNETLIHKLRADKKEQDKLNEQFRDWANKTREKANKLDALTRSRHQTHAEGITHYLQNGLNYSRVWGNDNDARHVLGTHLTLANEIAKDGTYILPPVDINNVDELREQLVTALGASASKLNVLIPLANNKHWQLGIFEITDGEITKATLWDSLTAPFLGYSTACRNMQKAINRAQLSNKPKAVVKPEAAGIQKNGYSCFDYVMQKALSMLKPSHQLSPEHKAIIEAKSATTLRQTITTQIATKLGIRPSQPKVDRAQAITTYNEEKLLKQLENFSKNQNKHIRKLQIDFDDILAKELHQRYQNPKDKRSDQAILVEARNAAYAQWHTRNKNMIQKIYEGNGLFGNRTAATKAELSCESDELTRSAPDAKA